MDEKPVEILLVEDDIADIELVKECLKKSPSAVNLNVVTNGEEAMKYLNNQGVYAQASKPQLILLDLNMPKKDGRQTLAEIREDDKLKTIPVIVVTTSESEADIEKVYRLGANSYVTKPFDLEKFCHMIHTICEFWLKTAKLPQ